LLLQERKKFLQQKFEEVPLTKPVAGGTTKTIAFMKNKNAEPHDGNSLRGSAHSGLRQHVKHDRIDNILSFEHKISE